MAILYDRWTMDGVISDEQTNAYQIALIGNS